MKYLLLLLSMLFIITSCSDAGDDNNKHSCSDNSGCETEEVCFYGTCFEEGDRAMGVKSVQIIGGASLELFDGDITPLRIQVVLSGTDEMKDQFSEDDLRRIVGPISNEVINYELFQDVESELAGTSITTDEYGMGYIDLSAKNTGATLSVFNIGVGTENCTTQGMCNKRFSIKVEKRIRILSLLGQTSPEIYTDSKKLLMARVTTNGLLPYSEQNVKFKITGTSYGSTLGEDGETAQEITVKTDYAGIARINLNAGRSSEDEDELDSFMFDISVSVEGTTSQKFNIKVKKRDGGCVSQEDCDLLGFGYQCESRVCIYVPVNCTSDANICPDGYECKESSDQSDNDKYCFEKPYICGDENNLDIASCRCTTDLNCPEGLTCIRGRCTAQDIACTENIDCPNGLICRELVCQPNGTQCKSDANCFAFFGPGTEDERCLTEDSCVCREGLCVNPCPDTEYIELSGGSGTSCSNNDACQDNEVCFTGHGVNKCIVRWDANYYFHLIEALPPSLQTILNGLGTVLGPAADILRGDDIDWGLPGWLSWLEETIVAAIDPLIDQYIPDWAQNLVIGLDDTIRILQEMKVKVDMSFVHDSIQHSKIMGIEKWVAFYIEWDGTWTEVKPEQGDGSFQVNSSEFTGSVACQLNDGQPVYSLYIDEHSAEFYFGRFVTAFLNGVLIPAVTNGEANSLGEAAQQFIDCHSLSETIVDAAINIVGDWASGFIRVSTVEGLCNAGVNIIVDKVNDYINDLHVGDAAGGSDAFKFSGSATIDVVNREGKKLKDGTYTGTLDLGGERTFTADWDAVKAR